MGKKIILPPPPSGQESGPALILRLGLQAALNGVQCIDWSETETLVQSQEDPTRWYTVAKTGATCTCKASQKHLPCAHRALVSLLALPESDEVAHCPLCKRPAALYVPDATCGAARCPHCHWAADIPPYLAADVYATLTGQTDLLLVLDDVLLPLPPAAPAPAPVPVDRAARATQAGRDLFGEGWAA